MPSTWRRLLSGPRSVASLKQLGGWRAVAAIIGAVVVGLVVLVVGIALPLVVLGALVLGGGPARLVPLPLLALGSLTLGVGALVVGLAILLLIGQFIVVFVAAGMAGVREDYRRIVNNWW